MELLLKRNEVGRNKYDLFAKLEMKPEEEARMSKAEAKNLYVWQPDDYMAMQEWRSAQIKAAVLAILTFPLGLIIWYPLTKWIFNRSRQGITFADLMTGRTIRCQSMDELFVKENAIKENAQKYHNAHEQMHSLGNEQRITFKPE